MLEIEVARVGERFAADQSERARNSQVDALHVGRIAEVAIRAEHQLVDDAEHRRVGADAQAEREDDRRGESRGPAETAQRIARILQQLVTKRGRESRAWARGESEEVE